MKFSFSIFCRDSWPYSTFTWHLGSDSSCAVLLFVCLKIIQASITSGKQHTHRRTSNIPLSQNLYITNGPGHKTHILHGWPTFEFIAGNAIWFFRIFSHFNFINILSKWTTHKFLNLKINFHFAVTRFHLSRSLLCGAACVPLCVAFPSSIELKKLISSELIATATGEHSSRARSEKRSNLHCPISIPSLGDHLKEQYNPNQPPASLCGPFPLSRFCLVCLEKPINGIIITFPQGIHVPKYTENVAWGPSEKQVVYCLEVFLRFTASTARWQNDEKGTDLNGWISSSCPVVLVNLSHSTQNKQMGIQTLLIWSEWRHFGQLIDVSFCAHDWKKQSSVSLQSSIQLHTEFWSSFCPQFFVSFRSSIMCALLWRKNLNFISVPEVTSFWVHWGWTKLHVNLLQWFTWQNDAKSEEEKIRICWQSEFVALAHTMRQQQQCGFVQTRRQRSRSQWWQVNFFVLKSENSHLIFSLSLNKVPSSWCFRPV